jgi:hypothetical protein
MRDVAGPASVVAHPDVERKQGRGHIGLVVLGSITGGLILGLTLTLGVFELLRLRRPHPLPIVVTSTTEARVLAVT